MPKCRGDGAGRAPSPCSRSCPAGRPRSHRLGCASIRRTAARLVRKTPRALTSRTASQPSSVHSSSGPSPNRRPLIPATWKRTSSRPPRSRALARTGESTEDSSATSAGTRPARPERGEVRRGRPATSSAALPETTTRAPSARNRAGRRQADAAGAADDQAGAAVQASGAGQWEGSGQSRQSLEPEADLAGGAVAFEQDEDVGGDGPLTRSSARRGSAA